jgi:hypothetical protein
MNNKDSQSTRSRKFDTAYINPCIDRVIEAIKWQKSGSKVLLVFENPLNRSDNFQITETFPLGFTGITHAYFAKKLWMKLFKLCPHLVQAQKVIYSHSKKVSSISKITDFLYKDHFNSKSTTIDLKRPENLSFLKSENLSGVIYQEYKINVSRLFIVILKHFESIGGKVLLKAFRPEEVITIIQCNSNPKQRIFIPIKIPDNFVLMKAFNKAIFRFVEKDNKLQVDTVNKIANKLSNNSVISKIQELISFDESNVEEIKIDSFLSLPTIKNILKVITEPLPGNFEGTQIKDNYELSLEKFDIAKQTGITYPEFKILYHRYGNAIDEMIDEAYEKMNQMRDPIKIWEGVEKEFQSKYEWRN